MQMGKKMGFNFQCNLLYYEKLFADTICLALSIYYRAVRGVKKYNKKLCESDWQMILFFLVKSIL